MPTLIAYDKDGLKIVFTLEKMPDSDMLTINVAATNNTLSTMTDFLFEAAVPRVSVNSKPFLKTLKYLFPDIPFQHFASIWNYDATKWSDYPSFKSQQSK